MNEYVKAVVYLLAGLGAFLIGFHILSDNIEKIATNRLKKIFAKVSTNPFVGLGIGVGVTAIIQSSSITTVMVVGFVNAGVMNLFQAAAIIMGANIGTTITAQIVALKSFDISFFAMSLTAIGIFGNLFSHKDRIKSLFYALAGLGLVFVGLEIMADSMSIFKESPTIVNALMSVNNPFLLLFIGIAFTGLVQSSSAVTTILISMVAAGLVIGNGGNDVLYVVLGTNIGTCVTALFSSIGATNNGKRAALIHLMFNVFGSLLFMVLLLLWPSFMDVTFGKWFAYPATQIAMFHTFFNVTCSLLFLGLVPQFVKISHLLIKDKKEEKKTFSQFDKRLLETPSLALVQLTKEVVRLGEKATHLLIDSVKVFIDDDFANLENIELGGREIEELSKEITNYLIEVTSGDVAEIDEKHIALLHHVLGDYMRLVEISDNFRKYERRKHNEKMAFSDNVYFDLNRMISLIEKESNLTANYLLKPDNKFVEQADEIENDIDALRTAMIDDHIKRLNEGTCSPNSSAVYINLVSNLERAGDHLNFIFHG